MSSISNYLYQMGSDVLSYFFPTEKDMMQKLPHFGASEWKAFTGLIIEDTEIPQHLLDASKNIDLFCPQHTIEETHILCCIPKGLSVEKLYKLVGKSTSFLFEEGRMENPDTYWCWIAKEPVLKYHSFDLQKRDLKDKGYDVPTRLEVMVAIYAAKQLGNLTIYPDHENATTCKSLRADKPYDIIGGDSTATFCGYKSSWRFIGVSSVLR